MAATPPRTRLAAILWFVAAALAWAAVGIGLSRDREPNWGVAAGGLFCLVMGIITLAQQAKRPPKAGGSR